MRWTLDILLVVLLTATLFHAVRLERALGVLKRDRAALQTLVATFNASTLAAETGIEHLREATDGAGKRIQVQIDAATSLKDDLTFMVQRGEGLADRLEEIVRAARPIMAGAGGRPTRSLYAASGGAAMGAGEREPGGPEPKVRSEAERDLLRALRMVR